MRKDEVELEYERAIRGAMHDDDNDRAQELAVGLGQYRELYKDISDA